MTLHLEQADLSRLEATLRTDKGDLVFGFHADLAPRHVRNFAELAQRGFYDGLTFHRVIRNFMIQAGCPNTRDGATGTPGTGGPGYKIDAEFNDLEHTRGALSMARSRDPNSAGSQFFVVHADHARSLDGDYTVFGYLKSGHEVLDAIATVDCDFGPGGERSTPIERVEIVGVTLREAEPVEGEVAKPQPVARAQQVHRPAAPRVEAARVVVDGGAVEAGSVDVDDEVDGSDESAPDVNAADVNAADANAADDDFEDTIDSTAEDRRHSAQPRELGGEA